VRFDDFGFPIVPTELLVRDGFISTHPVAARSAIREAYGCALLLSGLDCPGISLIRDKVQTIDSSGRQARSLMITAPHTHWGGSPIVESFDLARGVYMAGPLVTHSPLRPFSFVFTPSGPVAYEWIDSTVPLHIDEWADAYAAISRLAEIIFSEALTLPIPLGVTIDHRFKRSIWDEQVFTSAEGPHSEEDGRAVIRPVLESVVRPNPMNPNQVQVAWSAYPTSAVVEPPFEPHEAAILSQLEDLLRKYDSSTALEFLDNLEDVLGSAEQDA
jgi:hypothetical protein